MIIYTAQYKYSGEDRLDITVKGQDPLGKYFAPTWSMVCGIKEGSLTTQMYEIGYEDILAYVPDKIYKKLFRKKEVTLVCFCRSNQFCHRFLLAEELEKRGATYKGERSLV